MPELVLKLKGRELRRVAVDKPEVTVGRDPSADLLIDNPAISRVHLIVRHSGTQYTAVDQGSANGTWLRGARIGEHALADGDELQLGKHTVVFSMGAQDAPHARQASGAPRTTMRGMGSGVAPGQSSNPMGTMRMSPEQVQRAIAAGQLPAGAAETIPAQPASDRPPAPERGGGSRLGCIVAVLVVGFVALAGLAAAAVWYLGLLD